MSNIWGNPTWIFFHTLAEQVDESFFCRNRKVCFQIIKSICSMLPCPICRVHANKYVNKININTIHTKKDFINVLFVFHNYVNARLHKKMFRKESLDIYKKIDIETSIEMMCHGFEQFKKKNTFTLHNKSQSNKVIDSIKFSIIKNKQFFSASN